MFTLLRHQCPAEARILTHSVNAAFRPDWDFTNKCRPRTGLRFQNDCNSGKSSVAFLGFVCSRRMSSIPVIAVACY